MTVEKLYHPISGYVGLTIAMVLIVGGLWLVIYSSSLTDPSLLLILMGAIGIVLGIIGMCGLMAIAPNQARVLLLFGDYKGSVTRSGFFWVNPFFSKKPISLRIRNFETGAITSPEKKDAAGQVVQHRSRSAGRPSKVNDRDGNPIEISAVVVWKVVNTAEAMFEVEDFEDFVSVQSEAALRNMASRHPYDGEEEAISLRANITEISDQLRSEIQERLEKAGVLVNEARISHLAYAPEIAAAMLQRQQAQAVVAARSRIVEGAVTMVEMALARLSAEGVVKLDDEQRAVMVSNLLVVLCGDRHVQPVINTGRLHP